MPKGDSGFISSASDAAESMTGRGSGGYIDSADKIRQDITDLYKYLYRRNAVTFTRDANGNVVKVSMNPKTQARIDAIANSMSQNTVEFDRQANARYKDLTQRFQVSKPVFIRIEDSAKSAREQLQAGHFKIRTAIKNEYRINGQTVSGKTFRQNSMRERYAQVMGEAAARAIEERRGTGGTTDATWLNAANRAIDQARDAVYTRRGNNDYSSGYFSDIVRNYEKVLSEAQSRRRK